MDDRFIPAFDRVIKDFNIPYSKEIHFYEYIDIYASNLVPIPDWWGTEKAIKEEHKEIHTTQMGFLSTFLFDLGYKIFIHEKNGETYEIKLGSNNTRTNRDIKKGYDLFRLWKNGEFSG